MLQIKLLQGKDTDRLNEAVNLFLADFNEDAIKDIRVDTEKMIATILYIMQEEWKDMLCGDCRYWDDGDSSDALIGICQECGGRKRFNHRACERFKDIRR